MHFPADDAEIRNILTRLDERLSGSPPTARVTLGGDAPAAVLDWQEPGTEWLARHGRLHVVRPGDTLRSIAADRGVPLETLLAWNPYYRERYRPDAALPLDDRVVRLMV